MPAVLGVIHFVVVFVIHASRSVEHESDRNAAIIRWGTGEHDVLHEDAIFTDLEICSKIPEEFPVAGNFEGQSNIRVRNIDSFEIKNGLSRALNGENE